MKQRIVVIGAGFAGVWAALAAAKVLDLEPGSDGPYEVAVIAPEPAMTIRPRLYEDNPDAMAAPLGLLFDQMGIRYIQGTVTTIRAMDHEVDAVNADGRTSTFTYDRLILAAGSAAARPDIAGLNDYAFSVDQRDEAVALEVHLNSLAEQARSSTRNTIVVAGGGFTGLEIATELPARMQRILGDDPVRIIIVERADAIGPELGPGPRPLIEQALTQLGISTRLGSAVSQVHADGITTATGEIIYAATVIWTGGMRATPLTNSIPGERDALGRLRVDRHLRVAAAPHVFATGDAAVAATDERGNQTLMSCQHAHLSGRKAGENAAADLLGSGLTPYAQPEYFTCLDLGGWGALLTAGWDRRIGASGSAAKELKQQINSVWIYPPVDRESALAALSSADPAADLAAALASVVQGARVQ